MARSSVQLRPMGSLESSRLLVSPAALESFPSHIARTLLAHLVALYPMLLLCSELWPVLTRATPPHRRAQANSIPTIRNSWTPTACVGRALASPARHFLATIQSLTQ